MSGKLRTERLSQYSFLSGFAAHKITSSQWEDSAEIFLPVELKRILLEERQRRLMEARRIQDEKTRLDRLSSVTAQTPQPQSVTAAAQQTSFTLAFEHGVAHRNKRKQYPVVSAREVLRVADLISRTRDKEYARRDSMLLDRIKAKGALRAVANPVFSLSRWAPSVKKLRASHPHFAEVTNLVASYVESSARSKEPLVIPPLLLWGEPGIGKTQYAQDLSQVLVAPLRRQSMENAQTTSLLLGTERHWSSAGPGAILEEIVLGDFANPIFLLDEFIAYWSH
jgi:ATP-dependent Lon protease